MIRIKKGLVISFFNEISEITDQYVGRVSSSSMIKRLQADINYIIAKYQLQNRIFNYLSANVKTVSDEDGYADVVITLSVIPGQIFSNDIYELFNNYLRSHKLLIELQ